MNTLIIYDTTGYILLQMSGANLREPVGIPHIMVAIPAGKKVVSIDPTTNTPVFEDLPKTEIQLLQGQVDSLNIAMAEILGVS